MLVSMQIKMEREEREQVKADAYRHGMNISEYVRWLIQKERDSDAAMA